MHRYASLGICSSRCGFLLIARRSLFSLLRQRGWKETLVGLEYLWTWSLIFSLFLHFFFLHLSFARTYFVFSALVFPCSHIHTRILCTLHIFFHIFPRAWTLYVVHFPLWIPFGTFFFPLHGYCVLHMFPLTYSLFLFVSLFLYFVSCFWSDSFFLCG